jgi:phosphate-selective porin
LTGGGFSDNVAKANRILNGEDPENVLGQGKGKKTLNFYRNILNPNGNDVTVDTWAFRIAVGMDRTPTNKEMKVLERNGVYEQFANAYRVAAIMRDIPAPSAIQATTWVVMRGRES